MKSGNVHTAAGQFRKRVELQRAEIELNDAREPIATWTTFARRWARIAASESATEWIRGQLRSTTTYGVELRHDATTQTISTKDRVRYDGRELQIVGIINVGERDRVVRLTCAENITEPQE
jgi:SPP1 family predicted phage head-tail adaptor